MMEGINALERHHVGVEAGDRHRLLDELRKIRSVAGDGTDDASGTSISAASHASSQFLTRLTH